MTTKTTQSRVLVTLTLPRPVLARLALAKALQAAIAANPGIFKTPVPWHAHRASDNAAFDTAHAATNTVKGSVEARDANRVIVVADLHALRAYVQTLHATPTLRTRRRSPKRRRCRLVSRPSGHRTT